LHQGRCTGDAAQLPLEGRRAKGISFGVIARFEGRHEVVTGGNDGLDELSRHEEQDNNEADDHRGQRAEAQNPQQQPSPGISER
jgi:hypothetical protein